LGFPADNINDVENVITLATPLHVEFREFHLAFEQTNTPNKYRLKVFKSFSRIYKLLLPADGIVTFTSHDDRHPLPNPFLLQVHAVAANILNATARGERIEQDLRDYRDANGLAGDGSTDIDRILSISSLSLLQSRRPLQRLDDGLSEVRRLSGRNQASASNYDVEGQCPCQPVFNNE